MREAPRRLPRRTPLGETDAQPDPHIQSDAVVA